MTISELETENKKLLLRIKELEEDIAEMKDSVNSAIYFLNKI